MTTPADSLTVKKYRKFKYIEVGEGKPMVLLHGLFGNLSNFTALANYFKKYLRVIIPLLPLYELDLFHTNVSGMQRYVARFLKRLDIQDPILLGNSLGGHIALSHVLKHPNDISTLVLTGSSGLYENGLGDTYPKRNNYEYVKMKTQSTFYDPAIASKELVDEVYSLVNNRIKTIRILYLARSAIRNNLSSELANIHAQTLLIWGKKDIITPPFVGEEFKKRIKNSELHFISKCGHAPMMETPEKFNKILFKYLTEKNIIS